MWQICPPGVFFSAQRWWRKDWDFPTQRCWESQNLSMIMARPTSTTDRVNFGGGGGADASEKSLALIFGDSLVTLVGGWTNPCEKNSQKGNLHHFWGENFEKKLNHHLGSLPNEASNFHWEIISCPPVHCSIWTKILVCTSFKWQRAIAVYSNLWQAPNIWADGRTWRTSWNEENTYMYIYMYINIYRDSIL